MGETGSLLFIYAVEIAAMFVGAVCFGIFLYFLRKRMRERRQRELLQQGYTVDYTNEGVPVAVAQECPTSTNQNGIVTVEGSVVGGGGHSTTTTVYQSTTVTVTQGGVPLYLQDQPGIRHSQFLASHAAAAGASGPIGPVSPSAYGVNSDAAAATETSGTTRSNQGATSESSPLLSS